METPIDIVVEISLNLWDGHSVKSCVIYRTKKHNFSCLSNCRYCAHHAQNLTALAPNNVLIQIGLLLAEF